MNFIFYTQNRCVTLILNLFLKSFRLGILLHFFMPLDITIQSIRVENYWSFEIKLHKIGFNSEKINNLFLDLTHFEFEDGNGYRL